MESPRLILVVEDSELLHKMFDLTLMKYTRAGAALLHAFNGREALEKLSQHPDVDLVILDINMPVMSGLEFLQHCRRERVFQHIPVVIVSSEGTEADTIRGLQAGARAYVRKPFTAADLCGIIDRLR